jgi:hypothetical protein
MEFEMSDDSKGKDVVGLINSIDTTLKRVQTNSLDLSFNELMDMHKNGELDISPDYQRLFQWSEGARSRFVESLLLEMPVPPIYVIEEEDGHYLLIDGLQRISSYLHLRGHLSAEHLDPSVNIGEMLVLTDCDIIQELNGKTYDDLGTALQIRLKRAFVRVEVVRKGSDKRFKYHMFKRLNTGGQVLTNQQLRNCTIRLLDSKFNDFIIDLSKEDVFLQCTESLSLQHKLDAYDQELVLRFFAFKNNRDNFRHDVADFLTEYMELVSDPSNNYLFDYDGERANFIKTFTVLARTLDERAFTYANASRRTVTRGFSVYHFEAFTVGIQSALDRIDLENSDQLVKLKEIFTEIKLNGDFIRITTGGGKNSPGPLKERITFVQRRVEEAL